MGTYTTNYNLFMPTIGEQGWGDLVNGNFEIIDTTMAGLNTRMGTAESNITSLTSRTGTAETTITSNTSRIGTLETKTSAFDSRIAVLENVPILYAKNSGTYSVFKRSSSGSYRDSTDWHTVATLLFRYHEAVKLRSDSKVKFYGRVLGYTSSTKGIRLLQDGTAVQTIYRKGTSYQEVMSFTYACNPTSTYTVQVRTDSTSGSVDWAYNYEAFSDY